MTMKKCKYASRCGGCAYMGVEYEEQLQIKQKLVNDFIRPDPSNPHGSSECCKYMMKILNKIKNSSKK